MTSTVSQLRSLPCSGSSQPSYACAPAGSSNIETDSFSHRPAASSASFSGFINETLIEISVAPTKPQLAYQCGQQYSITALTDSSGTIVERYACSAYGTPTVTNATGVLRSVSSYDNRYTYTGREWDDTLFMYHYRARMYDAQLGRFLGRDPIGFGAGSFLIYVYLGSTPLSRLDPSGLIGLPIGSCGSTETSTTRTEITCIFDVPGWFGTSRRRVTKPFAIGGNPETVCFGMGIDGFAGYEIWRVTTTTTTRCTPCRPTLGGPAACVSITPAHAAPRLCLTAIAASVALVASSTQPDVKVDRERVPTRRPKDPPYFPPNGDGDGNRDKNCWCCDIQKKGAINDNPKTANCRWEYPEDCIKDNEGDILSACFPPGTPEDVNPPAEDPNHPLFP